MLKPTLKASYLAIAEIILPKIEQDEDLKNAFYENFKIFFRSLDPDSRSQLSLLIKFINSLSVIYTFSKLSTLNIEKRTKFLKKIEFFPINKVVAGFTGLRSLTLMSFYSMSKSWTEIGYQGSSLTNK